MTTDAIVLAAGKGLRLGGDTPKQFLDLGGRSVLARALDAFIGAAGMRRIVLVTGEDDSPLIGAAIGARAGQVMTVVGGDTRQASVLAGLRALAADPPDTVLVHDAARPFTTPALIARVVAALETAEAAIPAVPVADTLKRVAHGVVAGTVDRSALAQAQTPQGFRYAALVAAHAVAREVATDDAALMEAAGIPVAVVTGDRENFKITTLNDLAVAREKLALVPVVGQGYDVHRLEPGGTLWLGGLALDVGMHLSGHSDADVALHALTDALLGAIADGDIGHHFPPADEAWRGAASHRFLSFAAERARDAGEIAHLDLTIICERPKIGPVREAMRARIAAIAKVPVARVAVKATTTERLGFTGRGEGIAAMAAATVLRRL